MPRGRRKEDIEISTLESDELTKAIARSLPVVAALKCSVCGRIHNADSETFLTFAGNVILGTKTVLIGGNLDDKGKLMSCTILCRSKDCLSKHALFTSIGMESGI